MTSTNHKKALSKPIFAILMLLAALTLSLAFQALPLTKAQESTTGQDILTGLGCDDDNNDGLDFADCLDGGSNNGTVISFTDFQGDLAAPSTEGYASGLTQQTDLRSFILAVTNFALGFLGLLAVLIIIYGGVMTVASAGDADKASIGKKAITFAAIGLIIVMGSFAIVNTILQAPGGDSQGSGNGGVNNQTTIRGVSGRQTFNFLAAEIEDILEKLYNSYQFHLQIKQQMENIAGNITSRISQQTALGASTCQVPFSNCINNISALAYNQINLLNNFIGSPNANIDTVSGLTALRDELTQQTQDGINEILAYTEENDCNTNNEFLEINPCTVTNMSKIRSDLQAYGQDLSDKILSNTTATLISKSYIADLFSMQNRLARVYQNLGGVASSNIAQNSFKNLIPAVITLNPGQIYNPTSDTAGSFGKEKTAAEKYLKPSYQLSSLDQVSLRDTFNSLREIFDILKNIKFVDTIITADTVQGNAPLIVNFSTVGSTDPSGRTITNQQIKWDLNGDGIFASQQGAFSGNDEDGGYLNCTERTEATSSCIFTRPGTYRVTVKIDPVDGLNPATGLNFNQEIAPGISYVDIRVNPPATKINLYPELNGVNPPLYIIRYNNQGFIEEERSNLYVTLNEAKAGIVFNATGTRASDGSTPILNDSQAKIRWNFGIQSENNDVFEIPSDNSLRKTQVFPQNGSYLVRFEVTDKNGVIDRKVFTVIVSDLAPRITNPLKASKIGEEVTFDGSNSTSDGNPIIFDWTVEKLNNQFASKINSLWELLGQTAHAQITLDQNNSASIGSIELPVNIGVLANKRTEDNQNYRCSNEDADDELKCTFKRAGQYRVSLKLVKENDPTSTSFTEITNIQISSNPPSAGFNLIKLNESAPAVYKLDASQLSFDADDQGTENMEFSWEVNPPNCVVIGFADQTSTPELIAESISSSSAQTPCSSLKEFSSGSVSPVVKFSQKGDYTVNLQVRSTDEKESVSTVVEKNLTVENILDLAWGDMSPSAVMSVPGAVENDSDDQVPENVNTQPVAPITFRFNSTQAVAWELDFGDGITESGEFSNGQGEAIHNYEQTGKFKAKLTVYDADDIMNEISRNVYIGDGDTPVAVITVKVNGAEVTPGQTLDNEGVPFGPDNVVVVSRKDLITLEAANSVNTDGTGRQLRYLWNVNNNEKQGTTSSINHQFRDLSGANEYFDAKLTVTNQRNVAQRGDDTVSFLVIGEAPTLRSITAVPSGSTSTTPVTVRLNAIGAEDPDGQVTQYKWWYSPVDGPDQNERLGLQITTTPQATINIGTRGEEGEKRSYRFGTEITDSDNISVSTDSQVPERLLQIAAPTIEVTNGPNKAPVAKFTVDKTSVFVNDPVNFVSSSTDPDQGGSIKNYEWDFGDGTRDIGSNKSNVSHTYTQANVDGFKVRLRVTDNSDSVSTSDTLLVYVDAIAQPPVAAFTNEQVGTTKQVKFTNQSTADSPAGAELVRYSWDFDVSRDSNGDGIRDNDIDSGEPNPTYTYAEYGIFRARLTVEDNQGQQKFVTNFINLKPAQAPATVASNIDGSPEASDTPIKSMGANIFEASNSVDLTLLIFSVAAYFTVYLVAHQKRKTNR
ncbi:MAG: PKD domain-containing protein [Candidatus Altimarinota bacterium]